MTDVRTPADFARWAATGARELVFAGPDPYYGIGLETLVPGYRVACIEAAPAAITLRRRGVDVFVLDEALGGAPHGLTSTQDLLANPLAAAFLPPRAQVLVFKSSHELELVCAHQGWHLLAAPAVLARRWENKVAFTEIARELGLRLPPFALVDLSATSYNDVARQLGGRFVLQAPHGYGGARTFDVPDELSFQRAVRGLRAARRARATSFVAGLPLTLNACVTARGVAASAPFVQVTGLPLLTRHRLGSCGNDWTAARALALDPEPYVAVAETIGRALAREGFRGIFGLDVILAADGQRYLVEVNPRLVASIALFTQLELMANRLPLLARHVLAFLDPERDQAPLDEHLGELDGAQVILHNLSQQPCVVTGAPATGVYRLADGDASLRFIRPALRVDELDQPGELLVLAPAHGRVIAGGAACARIQTRGTVVAPGGGLDGATSRAVQALYRALQLEAPAVTPDPVSIAD